MIHYLGEGWSRSSFNDLDFRGSHIIAQDPEATAIVEFRGVAVYFLSPLWPWSVTTQVQLDSQPFTTIIPSRDFCSDNLYGDETVKSHVV
ncbi:hypothetical protein AN958_10098 [Leucoagaricus sp. SymC.cos]|nr:hypothetical protein AN958_10098 [Leucoagaricus sp. SymC.cos]